MNKKLFLLILLLLPSLSNAASISDFSPVSHWTLDETSGVRYDSAVISNDLTDNNSVGYTTGLLSNSSTFSTNQFLSINDASQLGLDLTTSFSFSYWVKFNSLSTNQSPLCKQDADSGTGVNYCFFYISSNGHLYFRHGNGSSLIDTVDTTTSYTTGVWYHVVGTFSTTNGSNLYIDGNLVASNADTATPPTTSTMFNIGRRARNSDTNFDMYLDGTVDETTVFNTELSSGDVTTLYNSGTPLPYTGSGGGGGGGSASSSSSTVSVDTTFSDAMFLIFSGTVIYLATFFFFTNYFKRRKKT